MATWRYCVRLFSARRRRSFGADHAVPVDHTQTAGLLARGGRRAVHGAAGPGPVVAAVHRRPNGPVQVP